jgi:hypothetical protein
MGHGTYETDIVGWSEDQAARLRRIAGGERPNDVGIDWPNVIEEIEDLGRSERRVVASQLGVTLLHVLKAYAWPGHPATDQWLAEATTALFNMRKAIDPGMGQRLDLAAEYREAREAVERLRMGGRGPRPMPAAIRLSFQDLRGPELGALDLLGRVEAACAGEEGADTP